MIAVSEAKEMVRELVLKDKDYLADALMAPSMAECVRLSRGRLRKKGRVVSASLDHSRIFRVPLVRSSMFIQPIYKDNEGIVSAAYLETLIEFLRSIDGEGLDVGSEIVVLENILRKENDGA